MKNPLAILNNIQLGKPNSIMVLHHTGFDLSGSVISSGLSGAEILASGYSNATDAKTAVAEVIAQIKSNGVKKIPKKAVLVSAAALAALVDLPVRPSKPRTDEQMRELVRWELEPSFARQNERWSIGALMMGRKYLKQDKRAQIMAEVLARNVASNQRLTVRFGEVAQNMKLVNRQQIDECLALQESLVRFDDEIICGWQPQQLNEDEITDDQTRFPWFVNAIADGQRKQWVNACMKNKLFLTHIYPSLGPGFSMLEQKERDAIYIDVQQEEYVVMRGRPGSLRSYRVEAGTEGEITVEQIVGLCYEEVRPDIKKIILNAPKQVYDRLSARLTELLEREVIQPSFSGMKQQPDKRADNDSREKNKVA